MLRASANWLAASRRPLARPVLALRLTNAWGQYLFTGVDLGDDVLQLVEPKLADGTWLADGTTVLDSSGLIEAAALVKSFGSVSEGLTPQGQTLLQGLAQDELPAISVSLNNQGGQVTRIACLQNLVGSVGEIIVGFAGILIRDFVVVYRGLVQRVSASSTEATVEMEAA